MRRIAVGAAVFTALSWWSAPSQATLTLDQFSSEKANVLMRVPRGWRISEARSYPGVLLRMARSAHPPPGAMFLTADVVTPSIRCAWPRSCRSGERSLAEEMACATAAQLTALRFTVGPIQSGNATSFEYDDSKRFLRHTFHDHPGNQVLSLVLATDSAADRASHARTFDVSARSLRPIDENLGARPALPRCSDEGGPAS